MDRCHYNIKIFKENDANQIHIYTYYSYICFYRLFVRRLRTCIKRRKIKGDCQNLQMYLNKRTTNVLHLRYSGVKRRKRKRSIAILDTNIKEE